MQLELAEIIVASMKASGFEANVRENYSGRGYGGTTTGVFVESLTAVLSAIVQNADHFVEFNWEPKFPDAGFIIDQMGKGYIIY